MQEENNNKIIIDNSIFNWACLNSNDYYIDQKIEYFNTFLNTLFISHVPNINNTIK